MASVWKETENVKESGKIDADQMGAPAHRVCATAHAVKTTIAAVTTDTPMSAHPSVRRRVGDGGCAATTAAVSSPGPAAVSTDGER